MTFTQTLARWLGESAHTVFFTGAGMSTESGLPDFRSSGGLWKQSRRFEELASVDALENDYNEFVEFYRWRIEQLTRFAPHRGHELIAEWQTAGLVHTLVTQNVDGFHERAGSSSPLCLHGTLRRVRCELCTREVDAETFLAPEGTRCPKCRGRMRPSVVLFGEGLHEDVLSRAFAASEKATVFVVLGSSLVVSPANLLPSAAKRAGAKLVIINKDPTPLDRLADLTCTEPIGATLAAVAAELRPSV